VKDVLGGDCAGRKGGRSRGCNGLEGKGELSGTQELLRNVARRFWRLGMESREWEEKGAVTGPISRIPQVSKGIFHDTLPSCSSQLPVGSDKETEELRRFTGENISILGFTKVVKSS